jgi:hypothetical protein
MFEANEFLRLRELYSKGIANTKEYRKLQGVSLQDSRPMERFHELLELHFELSGVRETNPDAIMHHERAQFGGPCSHCGKLLRTPNARKCYECGAPS